MGRGLGLEPVLLVISAWLSFGCGGKATENNDDRDRPSTPLCINGELRLSDAVCDDGSFAVEVCHNESWTPEGICREPDPCEDGAVVETEEQCGDYWYNRRLLACKGGLLQPAGCTCGAEVPWGGENVPTEVAPEDLWEERAKLAREETFLTEWGGELGKEMSGVLCVDFIWRDWREPPENAVVPNFESLVAVGEVSLGYIARDRVPDSQVLGNLRRADVLNVWSNNETLNGEFPFLREVRRLSIESLTLTSLDGLPSDLKLGGLRVSTGSELTSVEALSRYTSFEGDLSLFDVPKLRSLQGLGNLVEVGGSLSLPIRHEENLEELSALKRVGKDVRLDVGRPQIDGASDAPLVCRTYEQFSQIEIGGELVIEPESLLGECEGYEGDSS